MWLYLLSLLLLAGFDYIEAKALPPLSLEASSSNQTGIENPITEHILRKQHVVADTSDQSEPQDDLEPLNKELPHNLYKTQYSSQDTLRHNATHEKSEEVERTNIDANQEPNDDEFLSIIKRDPYFAPPETLNMSGTGLWSSESIRGRVKRDWSTHWQTHKKKYIAGGVVAGLLTAGTLIAQNMQNAQNFGGFQNYGVPNFGGGWWKKK